MTATYLLSLGILAFVRLPACLPDRGHPLAGAAASRRAAPRPHAPPPPSRPL